MYDYGGVDQNPRTAATRKMKMTLRWEIPPRARPRPIMGRAILYDPGI